MNLFWIVWSPNPVIFSVGSFTLLWYGVLFALGLVLAGWYVWGRFKEFGIEQRVFENLIIWSFFGIFLGARLGHCLFYEADYFLSHPIEMFLPVGVDEMGNYYFSGYHGLASHGAVMGLMLALMLFRWRSKLAILPVMDWMAIATALAGAFIRLGNLMNSEIVGASTDVAWAFVFPEIDDLPRHPAQLYESLFFFMLFGVGVWLFKRLKYEGVKPGFYLSLQLMVIAGFRFCVEFVKEIQVGFERDMVLNMGQWLSVPLFLLGVVLMICTQKYGENSVKSENNN
ncbi:MAG: prolipoprotein diacylglyceryl transferase [Paludibacteraceae bacterium]|nr:prolipoprotein diacylglyceryl transferase [Paludibacteraceae bacterium]